MCARRVLDINERTHCALIPPIMSTPSPSFEIGKRMLSFFISGYNHNSETISFYFKNCLIYKTSIIYKNLSILARHFDLYINQLLSLSKNEIRKNVMDLEKYDEIWKVNIIKELLNCKQNMIFNNIDKFEIGFILDWLCTS